MLADLHEVSTARNFFPDILVGIKRIAALVNKAQMDGIADHNFAAIGRFLAGNQTKQRRFTRTVRANHADNAARRDSEGQVFEQQLVAIGLGDIVDLDHLAAKAFGVLDDDLGLTDCAVFGRFNQLLKALDTRLGFGLSRFR